MTKTIINTTHLLVVFLVVITCIVVLVYHNYYRNSTEQFATAKRGNVSSTLKKDDPALLGGRAPSMKDILIPTIPVDLARYFCSPKYQKPLNLPEYEDYDDVFPDDPPMASCNPIKDKVASCKRLLNVVKSYDMVPFRKCINLDVFDKKDPVTGKPMRLHGKDYADCYKLNKIEYVNTNFVSIKEFHAFNTKIGKNCPNKEGLDVYLLVLTTWAKGKGLTGDVRELMGVPRLTYGTLIKDMATTYAKFKPLIDSYKQQNDTNIIKADFQIQVWFRELLAKCVDLWKTQVKVMTGKTTNEAFLSMWMNNVDLFFLQGIIMLCMITNTDFKGLYKDYVKIITHEIDDEGFIPAETRGDKSIDYIIYTLPSILDVLYYFNLFYGLKVNTSSKLDTNMLRLFYRTAHINLDILENPDRALIVEINKFQKHIVQLNKQKSAPLTVVPLTKGVQTLNLTTPDKKSQYLFFKTANTISRANKFYERYTTTIVSDIPAEAKVRDTFIYVKNNPTINIGLKMPNFLSIVSNREVRV
jgi:hypothetical protein